MNTLIKNQKLIFLTSFCILILMITFTTTSCKPKQDDNPEELITTLQLKFNDGSKTNIFQFRDVDGIGSGLDGVADTIILDTSKTYHLDIEVLDESTSPATIVSDEIKNEGIDHQFFFNISASLFLTQSYNDADANGAPIGLSNIINTSSLSEGVLRVNLKHQPGIKNGDQAVGESDIDVSFQTIIK